MFDITENAKLVSILHPISRASTVLTTEWISMKNAKKATFILDLGATASASTFAVTLHVADNASGTHSKTVGASTDLGLGHYYTQSGDTYSKTTVSSSTFNVVKTANSTIHIIEAEAAAMGNFTSTSVEYQADYVRLSAATPGAHAAITSCMCLLTGLRYQQDVPPSAIT